MREGEGLVVLVDACFSWSSARPYVAYHSITTLVVMVEVATGRVHATVASAQASGCC